MLKCCKKHLLTQTRKGAFSALERRLLGSDALIKCMPQTVSHNKCFSFTGVQNLIGKTYIYFSFIEPLGYNAS